jgi:hypothetical protein
MRACDDFSRFFRSVRGRIGRLRSLITRPRPPITAEVDRRLAYVSLEADNLILSANREFFVSSMLVRARTLSGHRVTALQPCASERDVVLYVMSVLEPGKYSRLARAPAILRRDETVIRDPSNLFRVANQAGLSNIASVQFATSLGLFVFDELKKVRHFYAHRNKDTCGIARSTLSGATALRDHPSEMLITPRISAPVTTIELWLDELELFYGELLR